MLSLLALPLIACPPSALPPVGRGRADHVLVSTAGSPSRWSDPSFAAPAQLPTYDRDLPLWDPAASLAEVEARSEHTDAPSSTPWVAWALARAAGEVSYGHLHAALSSPDLQAQTLAWWRVITPNPTRSLRDALADTHEPRTRALLRTSLALTELERSCPGVAAIDGSCRLPDSDPLLRRDPVALARGRAWTEDARASWATLDLAGQAPAARALVDALELSASALEYEAAITIELPSDVEFELDEWRRDSGVREWELEYARQVEVADASKAELSTRMRTSEGCRREQVEAFAHLRDAALLDHRHYGVVLLRSAGWLLALAELSQAPSTDSLEAPSWPPAASSLAFGLHQQAVGELDRCLELARSAGDSQLHDACLTRLEQIAWADEPPLRELLGEPRASSTVHGHGVVGPS